MNLINQDEGIPGKIFNCSSGYVLNWHLTIVPQLSTLLKFEAIQEDQTDQRICIQTIMQ